MELGRYGGDGCSSAYYCYVKYGHGRLSALLLSHLHPCVHMKVLIERHHFTLATTQPVQTASSTPAIYVTDTPPTIISVTSSYHSYVPFPLRLSGAHPSTQQGPQEKEENKYTKAIFTTQHFHTSPSSFSGTVHPDLHTPPKHIPSTPWTCKPGAQQHTLIREAIVRPSALRETNCTQDGRVQNLPLKASENEKSEDRMGS